MNVKRLSNTAKLVFLIPLSNTFLTVSYMAKNYLDFLNYSHDVQKASFKGLDKRATPTNFCVKNKELFEREKYDIPSAIGPVGTGAGTGGGLPRPTGTFFGLFEDRGPEGVPRPLPRPLGVSIPATAGVIGRGAGDGVVRSFFFTLLRLGVR